MLRAVSPDEVPPPDGTEGHSADHEARNAARAQRRIQYDKQERRLMRDIGGPGLHLYRNLADEFVHVDDQMAAPTPSANLAITANERDTLDLSPQVNRVKVFLKVAQI